jgi:hypothetical protein
VTLLHISMHDIGSDSLALHNNVSVRTEHQCQLQEMINPAFLSKFKSLRIRGHELLRPNWKRKRKVKPNCARKEGEVGIQAFTCLRGKRLESIRATNPCQDYHRYGATANHEG